MLNITVREDLSSHVVNEEETLEFFFPPYNVLTTEPFTSAKEVEEFVNSNVTSYNWWQPYVDPAVREQERIDMVTADNRSKRDALITATDWWASSDLTMTAEQIAYRQALRDITAHEDWPNLADADWPVSP
tara:strand:+ start:1625 stop:2017 length:393 start_codon:yes stop_codon:yes gene_type:complete